MARVHVNTFTTAVVGLLIITASMMPETTVGQKKKEKKNSPKPSNKKMKVQTADEAYIKKLAPKFKDFVDNCTNYMSIECSTEVVAAIFRKKNVTASCCSDMVDMGLECHNGVSKLFAELPEVRDNESKILGISREIYDYCLRLDKKIHPKGHHIDD